MDEAGSALKSGEDRGEVVIQGPNVMHGYRNNPEANASAFSDGWFRTGDQGFIDSDGYLNLTGRLKELINRGGEKMGPTPWGTTMMRPPTRRSRAPPAERRA